MRRQVGGNGSSVLKKTTRRARGIDQPPSPRSRRGYGPPRRMETDRRGEEEIGRQEGEAGQGRNGDTGSRDQGTASSGQTTEVYLPLAGWRQALRGWRWEVGGWRQEMWKTGGRGRETGNRQIRGRGNAKRRELMDAAKRGDGDAGRMHNSGQRSSHEGLTAARLSGGR